MIMKIIVSPLPVMIRKIILFALPVNDKVNYIYPSLHGNG